MTYRKQPLVKTFQSFIFLIAFSYSIFGQEISFGASTALFDHPASSGFGEDFPFIPLDYNGDSITDFIGGTYEENGQYLYKGMADGNFEDVFFEIGFQRPLQALDVDNDGDLDLIFEHSIQINNSDDTFETIDALQNDDLNIYGATDFNNDGLIDLISYDVNWPDTNELHVHYNLGGFQYDDTILWTGEDTVGDFELEDIDSDGLVDIAFIFRNGETLPAIILYNRDTSFETVVLTDKLDHDEACLKFVDLDNDSDLDMAAPGDWNDLLILENQDNFITDDQITEIDFNKLNYFDFADLDNDGDLDLVGHQTDGPADAFSLYTMTNLGNLEFGPRVKIAEFAKPNVWGLPLNKVYAQNTLSLYDYDGDDRIDVIYTDGHGDNPAVYLMLNKTEIVNTATTAPNQKSEIKIHPNPASEYILIDNSAIGADFAIKTIHGEMIQQGAIRENKIPIANLSNGIYILKIEGQRSAQFLKLQN